MSLPDDKLSESIWLDVTLMENVKSEGRVNSKRICYLDLQARPEADQKHYHLTLRLGSRAKYCLR